jgi:hypothetical protein
MPSAEVMALVNPWAQAVMHAGHNTRRLGNTPRDGGFFRRQSSRPDLWYGRSAHTLG